MNHSILHTVNQSPFETNTLQQCLDVYRPGDHILLLENGAYGALLSQPLIHLLEDKNCSVIEADLRARGLFNLPRQTGIKLIDYNEFVSLCVDCNLVQSWY